MQRAELDHDASNGACTNGVPTGRLLERLQQMLVLLDEPNTDGAVFERVSQHLSRAFEELPAAANAFAALDAGQRTRARAELEHAVRLNAVVRDLVSQRLAAVGTQVDAVRTTRRALESGAGQPTGGWCDAAG